MTSTEIALSYAVTASFLMNCFMFFYAFKLARETDRIEGKLNGWVEVELLKFSDVEKRVMETLTDENDEDDEAEAERLANSEYYYFMRIKNQLIQ